MTLKFHEWQALGKQLRSSTNYSGAKQAFQYAIDEDPSLEEGWRELALTLLLQNRPVEASQTLQAGLYVLPNSTALWTMLANSAFKAEIWELSVSAFRRVEELAELDNEMRHKLGKALGRFGNWESGLLELKKALLADPDNVTICCDYAECLYQLGNFEEAEKSCRKALNMDRRESRAWLELAACKEKQNDLGAAIQILDEALENQVRNAALHLKRARLFRELEEYEQANEEYNRVSELTPEDPSSACEQAEMFMEIDLNGEAVALLGHVIATVSSNDPLVWTLYAKALHALGSEKDDFECLELSLKAFSVALEWSEDNPELQQRILLLQKSLYASKPEEESSAGI
ncbi:MAG: tetratricopeptide repeat protein [Candidatus Obscuribacterales bacterium]|nr:tetratricopeptide repeat protein [Candidatus Obscuribacterales bacterium]